MASSSDTTTDVPVFERILEFRRNKDESWEPAMCCVTLANGQNLLLRLLDADGETTRFSTPLMDPLALQVDAGKLESDRRVDVFDEDNEHGVQLRFSSYTEGASLLLAMLSALLRSTGCVKAQVLILNEDGVRRAAGVDNPSTQNYSVHIAVQRASLYDSWSMAAQGDLIADQQLEGTDACRCQASVGEGTVALAADNPVAAAVLRARGGMQIAVAVDAAMLRGTTGTAFVTWLPDALREALGESNCIAALLLTVERVEVGDDAKRESIKRRLQRQGAHAGALRDSGTPVVLRKVAGTTPNRSFDYPIAEAAVAANSSFGPRSLPLTTNDSSATAEAPPTSSQNALRVTEGRQTASASKQSTAVASYDAEPSSTTAGSSANDGEKKKKKSKARATQPYDDASRGAAALAAATEVVAATGAAAAGEKQGRKGGSKSSNAALDERDEASAHRTGSPASPRVAAADVALDAQQLMDFQFKLDRKKQRILKLEAEVFQQLEAAEHQRQMNEVKEAEIAMQQATVNAERAQFAQQQEAFRLQQLTFYQQQQPLRSIDDGDDGANNSGGVSTKYRGTVSDSATRRGPGVGAKANASTPGGKGGERAPLLFGGSSGGGGGGLTHIQGPESTFTLRLEHPFYDNSDLPPAIQRCYPATTGLLHVLHHPCGVATLLALLGGGIGLIAWFTATSSSGVDAGTEPLWPTIILDAFAMLLVALAACHKTALYDGLHRLDQSCAQFDSTLFLYQRSTMFAVLPVCLSVLCFLSLLLLLATDVGTVGRVGLVLSAAGCTLSFGGFSLFLMLVATVAWDRVSNVVSADAGSLCTRLAARRAAAQYQFVKTLVASISGDWSQEITTALACMFAVMLYSVYAAIKVHSYCALLAYNSLFAWAALFSFFILKAVCGWQGATLRAVGHATLHCDRWARGDYNSEADMRLDDYVAFQQSLVLATQGGAYAKWVLTLFDDHGTVGRVWMWACGAMTLASLVMIPISIIYQFESWDG